jgi:hypothetical protein
LRALVSASEQQRRQNPEREHGPMAREPAEQEALRLSWHPGVIELEREAAHESASGHELERGERDRAERERGRAQAHRRDAVDREPAEHDRCAEYRRCRLCQHREYEQRSAGPRARPRQCRAVRGLGLRAGARQRYRGGGEPERDHGPVGADDAKPEGVPDCAEKQRDAERAGCPPILARYRCAAAQREGADARKRGEPEQHHARRLQRRRRPRDHRREKERQQRCVDQRIGHHGVAWVERAGCVKESPRVIEREALSGIPVEGPCDQLRAAQGEPRDHGEAKGQRDASGDRWPHGR